RRAAADPRFRRAALVRAAVGGARRAARQGPRRCGAAHAASLGYSPRMSWWQQRRFGRSELMVSRLGLGSSYRASGKDVERAVERGINYLYWGSRRRDDFGDGIARAAKRDRDKLCIVVQSYSRSALALGPSLEVALRSLKTEYADVLLLGWWNS